MKNKIEILKKENNKNRVKMIGEKHPNFNSINGLDKGITIVSLVVTIIVLIILVGITINLLIGEYTIHYKVSKTGYKSVSGSLTVKIGQATISILKVGDYVKYTPTAKSYTVATTASGTSTSQSFNTNTYTGLWRVLYNDSTNGLQLISDSTVVNLTINGKTGYNNLVGTFDSYTGLGSMILQCVHPDGNISEHSYTAGVRPVVKLKSTVKVSTGAGTSSSPWQLTI